MARVRVALPNNPYDIVIQSGALDRLGVFLTEAGLQGRDVFVISNPTVYDLYGEKVVRELEKKATRVVVAQVPDGEEYKSWSEAEKLLDVMVQERLDRDCLVVPLGGGVLGDLGGFVAAVYQRGVSLVQVPTTLLAQVDSSVGGKVGVNHPRAKNMIGAFHQPVLVVIDPLVLRSLPLREYRAGLSEVVKYGIIGDAEFFAFLKRERPGILAREPELLTRIIMRCCEIKADIVERDEREEGVRAVLNLGHTFGHAVESLTGYEHYRHGEAVAIGIRMACQLAANMRLMDEGEMLEVEELLNQLGLVYPFPPVSFEEFLSAMRSDKKKRGGRIRFVLPQRIGRVLVTDQVNWELLENIFNAFRNENNSRPC